MQPVGEDRYPLAGTCTEARDFLSRKGARLTLSGCRGFSVTELVVASLLAAVAITISLSLVGDWKGQYKFSGMVNSFQSAVNLAIEGHRQAKHGQVNYQDEDRSGRCCSH